MKTSDRDPRLEEPLTADEAPEALDRLIAEIRVPVAPGFSRQVMSRLGAAPPLRQRAKRGEWVIAAVLAALLIAISAALVTGGDGAEPGIAASVLDLVMATLAAGAGFLSASWRGLAQTLDAALDGSVTAMVALGLAALLANGLLVLLLRRRRGAAARHSGSRNG